MGAEIEVLRPGLYSTIQDSGRFGFLKFGVPMSGPMDSHSFKLGNMLLNNPPESASMEITQMGPVLKFLGAVYLVLTGADLCPSINNRAIRNFVPYAVSKGDVLSFGIRNTGCRSYLAVSGGFNTERIFGSQSWYDGITEFSRLEKGMKLGINGSQVFPSGNAIVRFNFTRLQDSKIQVFKGPEFHLLPEKLKFEIFTSKFKIDKNNNRMAVQLHEMLPNTIKPIITGPVVPGTVQLTPSGKIIILMRDCQATGGYPRILQLGEIGVNQVAQKIQGNFIEFILRKGSGKV